MVESPGTAPGSEPCITGAFIAIAWVTPDGSNIGEGAGLRKAQPKSQARLLEQGQLKRVLAASIRFKSRGHEI